MTSFTIYYMNFTIHKSIFIKLLKFFLDFILKFHKFK